MFPAGKSLPGSGLTTRAGGNPELSMMIGSSQVTIARYRPGSVDWTMSSGQIMTGDSESIEEYNREEVQLVKGIISHFPSLKDLSYMAPHAIGIFVRVEK